jgi:DNA-binding NarL/FixJ family response regulator
VIRVLVADDHAVVRRGVERLIRTAPDMELAGEASDGAEAVRLAAKHRPDVVLIDLVMPGLGGIAATRAILEHDPRIQVVALTSFSDRERIVAALEAGAVGYLLKDATPEELLAGVRAAARGESPLAPKAARTILEERVRPGGGASGLSDRERDVLALVARGFPNKVIARRLGIAEKTVKAHLTSAYRAIGVADRVQAALWAREHRLESPSDRPAS